MAFAELQDVKDAYEGEIPDAVTTRVGTLLEVANARLAARIPRLQQWIDEGLVDPVLARDVVVRTVLRQVRNPAETSQTQTHSQAAGPYSESVTYRQGGRSLAFDPDDLALLYPAGNRHTGQIHTRPQLLGHSLGGWRGWR